jgi:hypothetical protein
MALEDVALVAGTLQNLSNLYSLDIYAHTQAINVAISWPTVAALWWNSPLFDPMFRGSNPVKIALKC